MKTPRESFGQAIISRLQEIVSIGMPPAGYQLPRNELLKRLQLASAVCSPEIPGALGFRIGVAEGAICSVVSPAGRFVLDLPATQNAASCERVYTDLAGRATAHLAAPALTVIPGRSAAPGN